MRLPEAVESRDLEAEMLAPTGSSESETTPLDDAPTVGASAAQGPISPQTFGQYAEYLAAVKQSYATDSLFSKVVAAPKEHPQFELREGMVYTKNRLGNEVICVPSGKLGARALRELVIDGAHRAIGHLGANKTSERQRT
ncbi:hypothetical protein PUNSTDRAFT_139757 [Punctularia strigosozonata HHB-11173 SS5]|uniref:Integrase zinc-binding domain-containing protein n=1 Tax=Punctularia strigosozonata (strain HHB-11173) TaxID=741275 RepID=R7RZ24_PUNST|nr:uncharacterized protein PUNSTDRAFT_139757 [Punctularia strigosozonata HHB-11173 SS5]EIN03223.1 hypothetical protein PUNSTDRAFT_139757 [Punctularia strigosozonata HHB-11173 SS5]